MLLNQSSVFSMQQGAFFHRNYLLASTGITRWFHRNLKDTGRIFFYRPSSFGAAIRPDVMLNNEKVGEAISHGFFYVDLKPGEYKVVTSTEVERTLSFVLDKGQTRYVRFSISMGFFVGHVYGELVEPDVGVKEIEDCKYTGKP